MIIKNILIYNSDIKISINITLEMWILIKRKEVEILGGVRVEILI